MAPIEFKSINALEENSVDIYMESTEILLRIARNILNEPLNPKFRSLSLGSSAIKKLLSASGAMECLFEMGFEEGDDKLIYPKGSSLESIKYIHDELQRRRDQKNLKQSIKPINNKKAVEEIKESLLAKDLIKLVSQTRDSFLKRLIFWCYYVLKYENPKLQTKALKLVPLVELKLSVMKNIRRLQLEYKKKNISEEVIDCQELLLTELCNWFNTEFFTWVNSPQCSHCGFIETVFKRMSTEIVEGADRVEEYSCQKCNKVVLFPRYKDPDKLLQTRRGRCGEWANCFCLFCRAFGWDTRFVCDETDHVWVEVYSVLQSKWIHCDPCENVVNTPLMYECGWKKKLSYVIAYSKDEIQDVTWRYSCKHAQVLKNRKKCSEQDLVAFILKVRDVMLSRVSPARRNYVIKRTVLELVDLMKQNSASESEERGRISGSLAWRLLRGETTDEDFKPYIWKVEAEDEDRKKLVLFYNTSKDKYYKNSKVVLNSWKDGLYKVKSVFKKIEKDWGMTYLARTEGADSGLLAWKFESGDKFSFGTIELKLIRQIFETGIVSCRLCSGDTCLVMPSGKDLFVTDAFTGSKSVELTVELFGGKGPNSWQHAQILRQPLKSEESTFSIVINLVES